MTVTLSHALDSALDKLTSDHAQNRSGANVPGVVQMRRKIAAIMIGLIRRLCCAGVITVETNVDDLIEMVDFEGAESINDFFRFKGIAHDAAKAGNNGIILSATHFVGLLNDFEGDATGCGGDYVGWVLRDMLP